MFRPPFSIHSVLILGALNVKVLVGAVFVIANLRLKLLWMLRVGRWSRNTPGAGISINFGLHF